MSTSPQSDPGPDYWFEVDGQEYEWDDATITGSEVMATAGIPLSEGLVILNEDGTQTSVPPDDVIELKPGKRLKRRPRFKRG